MLGKRKIKKLEERIEVWKKIIRRVESTSKKVSEKERVAIDRVVSTLATVCLRLEEMKAKKSKRDKVKIEISIGLMLAELKKLINKLEESRITKLLDSIINKVDREIS